MKKLQLEQIIKEEIQSILKEGNVFPMWEDDEESSSKLMIHKNNPTLKFVKDFEPFSRRDGWGKMIMRDALEIIKAAGEKGMSVDDLFKTERFKGVTEMKPNMLHWIDQLVQDGYLEYASEEKGNDYELNESIKHYQKLAGIITEEYGISTKEAKSNDYYKKGMMSEEGTKTPEEELITLAKSSNTFNAFLKKAEAHLKTKESNPSRGPLTATSYVGKALKSIWNRRNN